MNKASINHFSKEMRSIQLCLEETGSQNPFDKCFQFESQMTLDELAVCFTFEGEELVARLKKFFSTRWERIQGSGFSYTHMPSNALNQLCYNIAKELSPLPESEEEIDALKAGEGPYFLLMPTLKAASDIYGTNIHNFALHQFEISDNGDVFIPVAHCLSHAAISDNGELQHIVSETEEYRPLSEEEVHRVIDFSEAAKSCYQAIVDLNKERIHGTSLGAKLQRLSNQLKRGGAHGGEGGEEYNAGAAADEGIVEFCQFWQELPEKQRQELGRKYSGLEEILGRLMRPNDENYRSTIYCVELLSAAIDTILEREKASIYNTFSLASYAYLEKNVEEKQALLEAEIARIDYKATSKKLGRFLETVTKLNPEEQFDLTGYHDSLIYACFHEPDGVSAVLKKIPEQEKQNWLDVRRNGAPILIVAVRAGNSRAVQALCDAGANLNATDSYNDTALGWAIHNRHIDTAKMLLEKGARLDIRNLGRESVLDIAFSRCPALIEPILRKIIDCDNELQTELLGARLNPDCPTILSYFCINCPDLVPALLQKMRAKGTLAQQLNQGNQRGKTPIILAAEKGNARAVQALCDEGANFNATSRYNDTALGWAIYNRHIDAAKVLLERGARLDIRNLGRENVLDIADSRCPALIEPILCKIIGCDNEMQIDILGNRITSDCPTVLSYFCINCPDLVPALLQKMREKGTLAQQLNQENQRGKTPIILAAEKGNTSAVQALCDAGADLNATDSYNNTALGVAVYNSHIDAAKLLLERGANLQTRNLGRENVLDIADSRCPALIEPILRKIIDCDNELQRELLGARVRPECPTVLIYFCIRYPDLVLPLLQKMREKETLTQQLNQKNERRGFPAAIILASQQGNKSIVQALCDAGADLNATDSYNDTALGVAIHNRHIDTAKLLLERGANLQIRNLSRESVLDIAVSRCPELTESLLLKILSLEASQNLVIADRKEIMRNRALACLLPMCGQKKVLIKNGFMLYDHLQCLKDCANKVSLTQRNSFTAWVESLEKSAGRYIHELLACPESQKLPSLRQEFRQCLERKVEFPENKNLFVSILLNILIAATGIGLLLVAVKYLATGSAFFTTTPRQGYMAGIEQSFGELDTDIEMGQEIRAEI